VLIVEDSEDDADLATRELERGGFQIHVERVDTLADMSDALDERSWDLILGDYAMPQFNGLDALAMVQERGLDTPFIVLSGTAGDWRAVECLRRGARDYVNKSHMQRLIPVVERELDEAAGRRRRREADAALAELNAHLEARVRERTAELEARNQEMDAFCHSISHDLRAPLRAIEGLAHLLLQQKAQTLDEEVQRYLQSVTRSTHRMATLVEDLLAFSRLSQQELRKEEVNPGELVRQTLEEIAPGMEGRHLRISVGNLPAVQAVPSLLKQVFVNLISNALKFTRSRTEVRLEIGSAVQDGQTVYWVRDNGVGFEMTKAQHLFTPFQRLHHPEHFEGTGLGLAIVKRIVERHGGSIWAESAPEQGATFSFTLETGKG
jgi:signal transduction histidine kinase